MQTREKRSILDCDAYETNRTYVVQFNESLWSKHYQRCTYKTSTARMRWINIRGCKLKKKKKQFNDPTPTTAKQSICLFSFFFLFASMWTNNSSRDTSALSSSVWLAPPRREIQWLWFHSYANAVVVYHSFSPTLHLPKQIAMAKSYMTAIQNRILWIFTLLHFSVWK